jgi:two-component system, NtrC family, sensor kinase
MSLKWKVVALLSIVSSLFAGTTYAVQRRIVLPGFLQAEHADAETDLVRCVEAVRRDGQHLTGLTKDWSAWDDTYQFIQDGNEKYKGDNLTPVTFKNNRLNLLAFVRLSGEMVWGEVRNFRTEDLIQAPELFKSISRPDHLLVAHETPESSVSGLFMTEAGPMLLSSQPIITSANEGPVRGAVIMGRLLDGAEIADLASRTRVELKLWPISDGNIPPYDRQALAQLTKPDSQWIHGDEDRMLKGYTVLRDVFGEPAMLLRADLPRVISQRGRTAAHLATVSSLVGGFAILLAVWIFLRHTVLNPLTALTTHAVRVGTDCDLRARLNMQRQDEIGILAREFDRMVINLAEFRARLLDTARRAGMAEVAVEVLHNVGNVLNSVNVSANLLTQKLEQSEIPNLGRAAGLLTEHQEDIGRFLTSDERGRQLPTYLKELSEFLATEQDTMLNEMKTLTAAVEHINQIVSAQTEHSGSAPSIETVNPVELAEEAIRLNVDSLERHHITLFRRFDETAEMRVDKHKVLQILINLISNAKNSVRQSGKPNKEITVKVETVRDGEAEHVRFSVADNGVGIAAENQLRIFSFGFSTSPNGRGCGLHSAANMAGEMAGSLTAASDGPDQGAVFELELPVARPQVLS